MELKKKEETDTKAKIKELFSWVAMIAVCFALIWGFFNVIIINASIPSGSMENTLQVGDRLIGTRFAYWIKEPKRGDIVMFKWPVDNKTIFIKRVIGLSGETVRISDGGVYINNSQIPLKEDYLKEEWIDANDGMVFHVPKGCYFMMGDNRNNSDDGRYWAEDAVEEGVADNEKDAEKFQYVEKKEIIGKAVFRYWGGFKNLTDTAHY
jgi:signal peptidase I